MKTRRPEGTSPAAKPLTTERSAPAGQTPQAAPPPAQSTSTPHASTGFSPSTAQAPTDLSGVKKGYVAPNQVESPFSPEERQQLSKKIPCPALAGLFNAGMLKVGKDGTVNTKDLDRALSQIGPSEGMRKLLVNGADKTDNVAGSFNLFKLNGSNLDHTGSTGIRQNGTHPERFELLKTFSKDGKTLTAKDLADAAEHFAKEDPGLRGRVTQLGELNIVLQVFGQRDANGKPFFTFKDAEQLFVHGQIPSSWNPPAVPGKVSIPDVLGAAAMGFFRQLINGQ
jgi:hypothetical protein